MRDHDRPFEDFSVFTALSADYAVYLDTAGDGRDAGEADGEVVEDGETVGSDTLLVFSRSCGAYIKDSGQISKESGLRDNEERWEERKDRAR